MLVLALDTTTRAGSCAVVRDGIVVRETATDRNQSHDAQLPAALMKLLAEIGVTLPEIDVYAVATGPGSFTGLRVGIATMQGLAFAMGQPLIGVSAFDALERFASPNHTRQLSSDLTRPRIATWIDAWRGEIYAALYEDGREIEPPTVARPDALLPELRMDLPHIFIGDAAAIYKEVILSTTSLRARIADPAAPLIAGTIALLAEQSVRAGNHPPPHAIRPLYVRRSDAELARHARPVR